MNVCYFKLYSLKSRTDKETQKVPTCDASWSVPSSVASRGTGTVNGITDVARVFAVTFIRTIQSKVANRTHYRNISQKHKNIN